MKHGDTYLPFTTCFPAYLSDFPLNMSHLCTQYLIIRSRIRILLLQKQSRALLALQGSALFYLLKIKLKSWPLNNIIVCKLLI